MIALLDSGEGGLNTYRHLHALLPKESLLLSLDYANSPYGDKPREELERIVADRLCRLRDGGAERILIACCTASTVYGSLPDGIKKMSTPIINPTARAARAATECGRIALLATSATVSSMAFPEALAECSVLQLSAGELVGAVEDGVASSENEARELLSPYLRAAEDFGADTLILGCTHFSSLSRVIRGMLSENAGEKPPMSVIDSAFMGAREMAKLLRAQ